MIGFRLRLQHIIISPRQMNRGRLFWKSDIGLSALLFVDAYAFHYRASISLHMRCYVMHADVSCVRTRGAQRPGFLWKGHRTSRMPTRRDCSWDVNRDTEAGLRGLACESYFETSNCIWIVYGVLIFYCMPHCMCYLYALYCVPHRNIQRSSWSPKSIMMKSIIMTFYHSSYFGENYERFK